MVNRGDFFYGEYNSSGRATFLNRASLHYPL